MSASLIRFGLLAAAAFLPTLASAQTPEPAAAPAPAGKSSFVPADFARFAPRTAFDMVVQLPGFVLRGAGQERGLGQASENVLINGQRIANKSGGAIAELQRTNAAAVERIDLVEAAQLGIAGLSGQVANVILKSAKQGSGQFEWRPQLRAHYAHPRWFSGLATYSDKAGPFDYKLSVDNQASRGAYGGPAVLRDQDGLIFERRSQEIWSDFDQPKFSVTSGIDGPGSSVGNMTLAYTPYWSRSKDTDRRLRTDGDDRTRVTRRRQTGYFFDANGDFAFALGPGRLKIIGVRHFEHEPTVTTQVTAFDSGSPDEGIRFERDVRIGETIARAEYGLTLGRNSFELSLEGADNRLEQVGRLFILDPDGEFIEQDFPEGSGIVQERRYEALLTWSRPLSSKLDLQLVGGGEISRLERVDGDLPARKFFRPKGSLTLGWRPSQGLDVSLKLNRRVGQISFYDFLSQPRLSDDRENAGNPDLVPPQSWEAELEVGRTLGPWGKTRLRGYYHRITDIVDIVPIGEDGEGIGNLPKARRMGAEWISTFNFDPLGLAGAKLDATIGFEGTHVRDPLTGEARPISGSRDRWAEFSFRHDIPQSDWAYGASVSHGRYKPSFYLTEVNRVWEGPWFDDLFVEHKDVLGMTVRATVSNLLNARHRQERFVYNGRRNVSTLRFRQSHDQLIGPIFSLSVRGNF
jgi:hypothetical protein